MNDKKGIQVYLSRVASVVNQMRSYGEIISNTTVVSKVLRILTRNYNHMVAAIEESKDLSTYSFDELMCSLLAHKVRINKEKEKVEEKAFQVRGEQMSGLLIMEVMVMVEVVLVIVVVVVEILPEVVEVMVIKV